MQCTFLFRTRSRMAKGRYSGTLEEQVTTCDVSGSCMIAVEGSFDTSEEYQCLWFLWP